MSHHIIESNLNGEIYRDILKNEVPTLRQNMWFQHDGCPAHARKVLDHDFNGHWISSVSSVSWPTRLPDLSSPDLILGGYLKDKVYKQEPITHENAIGCLCQNLSRNFPHAHL